MAQFQLPQQWGNFGAPASKQQPTASFKIPDWFPSKQTPGYSNHPTVYDGLVDHYKTQYGVGSGAPQGAPVSNPFRDMRGNGVLRPQFQQNSPVLPASFDQSKMPQFGQNAGGFMPNSTAPVVEKFTPMPEVAAPVTAGAVNPINNNYQTDWSSVPAYAKPDYGLALQDASGLATDPEGPGLFTQGLEFLGKNKDGINAGIGLAQTGLGLYTGLKGMGLAEDQFNLNRDMQEKKLAMYREQMNDTYATKARMLGGNAADYKKANTEI